MKNITHRIWEEVYYIITARLEEQFNERPIFNARKQISTPIWDSLKWQLQHHIYNQIKDDCYK